MFRAALDEHRVFVDPGSGGSGGRAAQAMKRKKMYEQQRDQLIGTQFNIENLAFQQEQAEITCTAVEAMKACSVILAAPTQVRPQEGTPQELDQSVEASSRAGAPRKQLGQFGTPTAVVGRLSGVVGDAWTGSVKLHSLEDNIFQLWRNLPRMQTLK